MNFDDIQQTWRSPQNRPSPAQLEELKMKFVADLNKRHRASVAFMTFVGVALIVFSVRVVLHLLWPNPRTDPVDFAREWALIPFFAVPWIGWIFLVRRYRRHRAQHPNYDRSIGASARALLDENRLDRARYKMVVWLQAATLVVLPLIVFQLRAVGKAGDEILIPAFVIWPLLVLGILAGMTYHYRRKLLPRKLELEALVASYENDPDQ